jgi:hypothetical protein
MSRVIRRLAWIVAAAMIATVSGRVTFASFTRTTQNTNNIVSAGTVVIADNDAGSVMWDVANQLPTSAAIVQCIRVTYTGSLPAEVRLFASNGASGLDPYLNVTIEKGSAPATSTFPSCAGFTPQATISPTATLQAFKAARAAWASGIPAFPGTQVAWNAGDSLVYRFTLSLQDVFAAQGLTAVAAFTWEAQNR